MKFKKVISTVLATALLAVMVGCSPAAPAATPTPAPTAETPAPVAETPAPTAETPAPVAEAEAIKIAMVTDTGGVNDESFNQSAWEGLQRVSDAGIATVNFLESKQEADYPSNLDKLVDEGNGLIWGIGFMMGDAVKTAAQQNPDKMFGIIDYAYPPEDGANLIGVVFKAQDPSFAAGYMAAKTSVTGKLGFIGGMKSDIIDQFEYGYRGGIAYAGKELGKTFEVEVQYVESWTDDAKVKATASQMYTKGADVIFTAAGNAGKGMFEAAKEYKKYCIGVDSDQSHLAPEYCLTSALKQVGNAMYQISEQYKDGKALEIGGKTHVFGLAEGGVGLPEKSLATPEVHAATLAVEKDIADGKIAVPFNEATLAEFEASLK